MAAPRLTGSSVATPSPSAVHLAQIMAVVAQAVADADPPQLAQVALDALCRHLGARSGLVALRDEEGLLQVQAVSGRSSLCPGDAIHMPRPAPGVEGARAFAGEEIALLLPLRTPWGEEGLLGLGPPAGGSFAEDEVAALLSAAGHLALALENARLRRRLMEAVAVPSRRPRRPRTAGPRLVRGRASALQVAVHCLGELAVAVNARRLPDAGWGGRSSGHRHARAVFALLLANRPRAVDRHELIDVIWGDSADVAALENRLDRTVSALRRALEPALRVGGRSAFILSEMDGYRLNPALAWQVDAEEFARLLAEASSLLRVGAEQEGLARCLQAVALYRGDYLAHCPFVERSHVVSVQREMLRREHVEALLRIAELYRRQGSPEQQLRYLRQAAREDEFNERAYQALVAACCEHSRHAEARLLCQEHQARLAAAELACSRACFPALAGL